ncbi:hypothetical protein ACFLZV_03270 [Candidatus Margulisiibacteriota bacterium]
MLNAIQKENMEILESQHTKDILFKIESGKMINGFFVQKLKVIISPDGKNILQTAANMSLIKDIPKGCHTAFLLVKTNNKTNKKDYEVIDIRNSLPANVKNNLIDSLPS